MVIPVDTRTWERLWDDGGTPRRLGLATVPVTYLDLSIEGLHAGFKLAYLHEPEASGHLGLPAELVECLRGCLTYLPVFQDGDERLHRPVIADLPESLSGDPAHQHVRVAKSGDQGLDGTGTELAERLADLLAQVNLPIGRVSQGGDQWLDGRGADPGQCSPGGNSHILTSI
jgi:hypothetical protein